MIYKLLFYGNKDIYYSNGSVFDFYDPYKNEVIVLFDALLMDLKAKDFNSYKDKVLSKLYEKSRELISGKRLMFPLIVTQTPLRAFGTFEMKRRYVEYYYKLKESDVLIILGYGFGKYDADINSVFKEYLKTENKKMIILQYNSNPKQDHIRKVFSDYGEQMQFIDIKNNNFLLDLKRLLHI